MNKEKLKLFVLSFYFRGAKHSPESFAPVFLKFQLLDVGAQNSFNIPNILRPLFLNYFHISPFFYGNGMKTIEFFHAVFSFFNATLNSNFEGVKTILNKLKSIAFVYNFNVEGGRNCGNT